MEFKGFGNWDSTDQLSIENITQNSTTDQIVQLTSTDKNSIRSSTGQSEQKSTRSQPLDLNLTLGLSNQVSDYVINEQMNNVINYDESVGNSNNVFANFNGGITNQGMNSNMNMMPAMMNRPQLGANSIHGGTNVIPASEWLAQANAQRAAAAGNYMPNQMGPPHHYPVPILPAPAVGPSLFPAAAQNDTSNPMVRMNPAVLQPGLGEDPTAPHLNQVVLMDVPARRAHRARDCFGASYGGKRCTNFNCNTAETPMWRRGPLGPKSLCNACGIKYRKELDKKKLREAERILQLQGQI